MSQNFINISGKNFSLFCPKTGRFFISFMKKKRNKEKSPACGRVLRPGVGKGARPVRRGLILLTHSNCHLRKTFSAFKIFWVEKFSSGFWQKKITL